MPLSVSSGSEPVPGYRIVRKLGQGGFGEVWEAEAPGGVRVAMKLIRLGTSQAKPELRALEIIRNIRHPHLLDIQFSLQVEDALLIAMPLCDQSLWDRFKECQSQGLPGLPRVELFGYMEELAKAVDYLNEPRHPTPDGQRIGIQHRDIKPHNIFLVGGCVRLADFGLAKFLQDSIASHTGSMSPNYVAPEALKGVVAPQSDQYSVAVTYFQLRTGGLPITGKTIGEIIYNHLNHTPDLSPLPEGERPVVGRALAKEPEVRWPSCQAFVANLRGAMRIGTGEEAHPSRPCDLASQETESATRPGETVPMTGTATGVGKNLLLPDTDFDDGSVTVDASGATSGARSTQPSPDTIAAGPRAGFVTTVPTQDRGAGSSGKWRTEGGTSGEKKRSPWPLIAGTAVALLLLAFAVVALLPRHPTPDVPGPSKGGDQAQGRGATDLSSGALGTPAPDKSTATGATTVAAANTRGERRTPEPEPEPVVAPPPRPEPRPFRGERYLLTAIRDSLRKTPEADRKYQRFFHLASLHNQPGVALQDLRLARAALAKLVNSLSWEPALVVPSAVDEDGIVLSIDLRRLGWDRDELWSEILKPYPYGLTHGSGDDPLNAIDTEVRALTEEDLPHVRADWFVAIASRPPLYHTILRLPSTARALEETLGIDVQADLLQSKVIRAGLVKGTATGGGQVFERHEAPIGGYWTTYDLLPDREDGELLRFPLGPDSPGPGSSSRAFVPSSRSILFPLPNGLQAYLLVDRDGKRSDSAPSGAAHELRRATGRPSLINGLSCIACHRAGVLPINDEVRRRTTVTGEELEKVKALYPEPGDLERLITRDQRRFLKACDEATAPFLDGSPDGHRTIREGAEPVSALAQRFHNDLGPDEIAGELGVREPQVVLNRLKGVPRFRKLGLEPLFNGHRITREVWDNAFDQAAIELDVGTPHRSF